jgi:hypothetical protein
MKGFRRSNPKRAHDHGHGIQRDIRGQDQPTDKASALRTTSKEETAGERAQREAPATGPRSPGQPKGFYRPSAKS